jgi:hypothetical protein
MKLLKSKTAIIAFLLLILFTGWWLMNGPFNPLEETEKARHLWGGLYQVMAYFGAVIGLYSAKKWGGFKSILGKAIIFLSLGLLLQGFGQTVYTYFLFAKGIEAPYPSIGDIGYFGTIPFYIAGVIFLARVVGARFSFNSLKNYVIAVIIPVVALSVSYWMFLRGYEFDWSSPLTIFLDFGYPLGQAVYVSIAILVLLFSRKVLGGIMRNTIWLLLFALIVQYLSDYVFLYQNSNELWYVGGINDYMYLFSYFLMTISLIKLGVVFNSVTES